MKKLFVLAITAMFAISVSAQTPAAVKENGTMKEAKPTTEAPAKKEGMKKEAPAKKDGMKKEAAAPAKKDGMKKEAPAKKEAAPKMEEKK